MERAVRARCEAEQAAAAHGAGDAGRAAAEYAKLAAEAGLTPLQLALRWARQRQSVTTCLVGATSMAQLEERTFWGWAALAFLVSPCKSDTPSPCV